MKAIDKAIKACDEELKNPTHLLRGKKVRYLKESEGNVSYINENGIVVHARSDFWDTNAKKI